MTWTEIERNWNHLKQRAKSVWPSLNEAELEVIDGRRDRLIDKVRDAQHLSHEAAVQEVEAWRRNLH